MKNIKFITFISAILFHTQIWAADLLTVYKQALMNDPTFQVASAQWLSDKENIAITRGALLPAFDVDASYGRFRQEFLGNTAYYTQSAYTLTLTQPIFNFQAWAKLSQAKASVKSSAATYSDAAQNLIYRTATRYLDVLQAEDVLRFAGAQRKAVASLLDQTKQRFNVGLSTITDVQQAKANYDSSVSAEITAKNDLDIAKEQLREITGKYNKSLAALSANLPFLTPDPNNIGKWVAAAERQNYSLLAARYNLQAAHENIKVQVGSGIPVINALGQYDYSHVGGTSGSADIDTANQGFGGIAAQSGSEAMIGLNMTFPVFRGGSTIAQVQQARYDYQKASAALEQTHRTVVSQTSQAFLGVLSGISSVKAGKQSVISNASALDSTRSSYSVGVKTIVDVLLAESSLYQAQKDYAVAQYSYLTQTLALKLQAGTLGLNDLRSINSWLKTEQPDRPKVIKAGYVISTNANNYKEIFAINPHYYTIQLLADNNPNKLIAFVNKHNIEKPIYTFKVHKQGHIWYALTTGKYTTLSAAQSAKLTLMKHNKDIHPWIRTFSSIQSAIRK